MLSSNNCDTNVYSKFLQILKYTVKILYNKIEWTEYFGSLLKVFVVESVLQNNNKQFAFKVQFNSR